MTPKERHEQIRNYADEKRMRNELRLAQWQNQMLRAGARYSETDDGEAPLRRTPFSHGQEAQYCPAQSRGPEARYIREIDKERERTQTTRNFGRLFSERPRFQTMVLFAAKGL